jgi:hypothetical protein
VQQLQLGLTGGGEEKVPLDPAANEQLVRLMAAMMLAAAAERRERREGGHDRAPHE